jgi:hypothetical protein
VIRRSWRTQLKATTTQHAVLTVVSHYLDEWTAEEVAALPRGAWPSGLRTRSDVLAHAVKLGTMHAGFSGGPAALAGLQELLLFFTHAAVRTNQLASIADAEKAPAPQMPAHKKPATNADE